MGTVVDEDGLVVGADNIHVVDASVFPDLPTTNTYLPTLMLAERLPLASSTSSAPTGRDLAACGEIRPEAGEIRPGSHGGEQLVHRLVHQLGEAPDVGDELAVGDEAEVEVAVVALHRHVQALPVGQRRDRVEVLEAGAR